MQAAGYPRNSVDVSVLEDPEGNDISEILEALNVRIERGEIKNEEYSTQDYPLISKKYAAKKAQPGEPNKFGKNMRLWWMKWIERMKSVILQREFGMRASTQGARIEFSSLQTARLEEDDDSDADSNAYCWDVLKVYTLALSSSPMRHVRHTATYVALALCSGLCQAGRKAADEEAALERQLQAEKNKTGKRHENLQARAEELKQQRIAIDRECTEIFNS